MNAVEPDVTEEFQDREHAWLLLETGRMSGIVGVGPYALGTTFGTAGGCTGFFGLGDS